jgi:hypothetical protein
MELSEYDLENYKKLLAFIELAKHNSPGRQMIEIKTEGTDPYCSLRIHASTFKKLIIEQV